MVLTVVLIFAMTAAWYTNIVDTSGLTFVAEAWGFNGTITVDTSQIEAAPGDEGIIAMTVVNEDQNLTDININVSKATMAEEMQKRLFFYADAQQSRNGETMERVYLNNRDNYTYTLFSNGTLKLSEELHNGALLKWQWVYDMLGYYVLGKWDATSNTMIVDEYLRPIEYDYDEATTTFEKTTIQTGEGEVDSYRYVLKTVDGSTDIGTFLHQLSQKDGYTGQIDTDIYVGSESHKYYPITGELYGDGYGIYAYLCNYSEIQKATEFDTWMGQAMAELEKNNTITNVPYEGLNATDLVFRATMTISAQKGENRTLDVTTMDGLKQAMAIPGIDVVKLNADVSVTAEETLTLAENQRIMLDLNGHSLVSVIDPDDADMKNKIAIDAQPGSSLTIINGTISGQLESAVQIPEEGGDSTTETEPVKLDASDYGYAIQSSGAEVVLSGVTIENFKRGIYINDKENDDALDTRVYMYDCEMKNIGSHGIVVIGNGYDSSQKAQLIIEESTLYSDSVVLSGNGTTANNGSWGTDIQIINSTLCSTSYQKGIGGAAIYHPQQNSTLTVYDSTITGYTGIAMKGGVATIKDSTINGMGPGENGTVQKPSLMANGFDDTGDAVYMETRYIKTNGSEMGLTIENSRLTAEHADSKSLRVFEEDEPLVWVKIISGIFDEVQPDAYIAEGSIKDGTNVLIQSAAPTEPAA